MFANVEYHKYYLCVQLYIKTLFNFIKQYVSQSKYTKYILCASKDVYTERLTHRKNPIVAKQTGKIFISSGQDFREN